MGVAENNQSIVPAAVDSHGGSSSSARQLRKSPTAEFFANERKMSGDKEDLGCCSPFLFVMLILTLLAAAAVTVLFLLEIVPAPAMATWSGFGFIYIV